jgi:hypothetical protein
MDPRLQRISLPLSVVRSSLFLRHRPDPPAALSHIFPLCLSIISAYEDRNLPLLRSHLSDFIQFLEHFRAFPISADFDSASFFEFLVSLLCFPDSQVSTLAFSIVEILASLTGDVPSVLVRTPVLERACSALSPDSPHLLAAISILKNVFATPDPCLVDRLFGLIPVASLLELADASSAQMIATLICNVTQLEPPATAQSEILSFVSRCYLAGWEDTALPNVWTICQLASFASFEMELFCELRLQLFLNDLLFSESSKLIYVALLAFSAIFARGESPVDVRFDGILAAMGSTDEPVIVAAFQAARRAFKRSATFRGGFVEKELWRDVFAKFGAVPFAPKRMIAQFIAGTVYGVEMKTLRAMIKDGLLEVLAEFITFDEADGVVLMAVKALLFLVKVFEREGTIGFFEMKAAECLEAEKFGEIARGASKELARAAAILQARLLNMPNGAFLPN